MAIFDHARPFKFESIYIRLDRKLTVEFGRGQSISNVPQHRLCSHLGGLTESDQW